MCIVQDDSRHAFIRAAASAIETEINQSVGAVVRNSIDYSQREKKYACN